MSNLPERREIELVRVLQDVGGKELRRTVFRPAPVGEPGVEQRLVSEEEGAPAEVITEFSPSAERPATYPSELPFLPETRTFTTVFADGRPPSARWRSSDPVGAMTMVVEQSEAAGWVRSGAWPETAGPRAISSALLTRGELTRMLAAYEMGGDALVQLQDVPTAFVQRSPSPAPR